MSGPSKIHLPGKPVYYKLTEDCDFFALFQGIEPNFDCCFLLESLGEQSAVSRHHIMGFDPVQIISATDYQTLVIDHLRTGKQERFCGVCPFETLRSIVPQDLISRRYAGGLTGYLGYDAVNFFEPHLNVKGHRDFEPFKFGVYLDGLVYDQVTGEVFYYHFGDSRLESIKKMISQAPVSAGDTQVEALGNSMSREQHADAVMQVKKEILQGRVFQAEVGFKSSYRISGETLPIYAKLRTVNPSPHMYYMKFGEQKIIGASPELLLRLRSKEIETYPLAGTAKRGANAAEDKRLSRALLNDPKEIAEHNMLVDLHRNDLGRVARFGTVKVRNLMDIKRYSHVQHISSEIVGILSEQYDMFLALAASFPAGTLSGAPKIEAMKIINELEPQGRGPYGGALGQFGFNGDCTFAIPIRTVFIAGERAYIQTSGGNVYDSNAADEYLEIERKLKAMKSVLESFM